MCRDQAPGDDARHDGKQSVRRNGFCKNVATFAPTRRGHRCRMKARTNTIGGRIVQCVDDRDPVGPGILLRNSTAYFLATRNDPERKIIMKNAHERFGVLEYTERMRTPTTRIRLRLDRFIGEIGSGGSCKAHLISVLGGDSDVGAIWAAVIEQSHFTVEAKGIEPATARLGEDAECFRGTTTIPGRKPIRHLAATSAELVKTRPGADRQGR